jgi:hypothetical protein
VHKEFQDLKDRQESLASQASKVFPVLLEPQELAVLQDFKEFQDLKVQQDFLDLQAFKVFPVHKVLLEFQV